MRLVVESGPGEVSLSWMWMPAWLGQHTGYLQTLEQALIQEFAEADLTDETLERMHAYLCERIGADNPHISGLREWLAGLSSIEVRESGTADSPRAEEEAGPLR